MKKLISLLLCAVLLAALIASCGAPAAPETIPPEAAQPETAEPEPTEAEPTEAEPEPEPEAAAVRLGGLTGPTTIGLVKLLDDAENGLSGNAYDFKLAGSADELTPLLLKGELDILAAPVNLGAVLYAKTEGKIQMLAVDTLGVLYIVEKGETITDWASLNGKTIYATGKGSVPEYVLSYLLTENGLDPAADVMIEWKSEPAEIVAQLASMDGAVAMLPQPYVTVAQSQVEGLRVALDLTASWDALDNGSRLVTAGIFVRREFAESNPEVIANFLQDYAASAEYVNANVPEAAQLVEKYGIVKAAVAEKAIPFCNVVCITGEEMKTVTSGCLEALFAQNPASVGGALPADDFFYAK